MLFNGDLTRIGCHNDDHTLKERLVEPDRKFTELTYCARFYNLAYYREGSVDHFNAWATQEEDILEVDLGMYKGHASKGIGLNIAVPNLNPYDFTAWAHVTRQGITEIEKNAFSFFSKSKQGTRALEWQNVCQVYSKSSRTVGIVFNGEVIAAKNLSDVWANEDNFMTSLAFEPFYKFENDFGWTSWR